MSIDGQRNTFKHATNLFCYWGRDKELIIDDEDRYTGLRLNQEARSIAQALLAQGVGKGDVVTLVGLGRCRFYAAYFAVHKLGAVACNIHLKESRVYIANSLKKLDAKLAICSDHLLAPMSAAIGQLEAEIPLFSLGDELADGVTKCYPQLITEYPADEPEVEIDVDDPAVIILSSGSTGVPKGIIHSNRNFVAWLQSANALFGAVSRSTRFLVNVGTSFAAWPFSTLPVLYAGGTLIVMDGFTPEGFCQKVEKEKATMAGPVPTMIRMLSPDITEKYDLRSFKMILCAGEPPTEGDIERILTWAETDIRCLYLASESAPGAGCYWELSDLKHAPICAGKPVGGADIRVVDPEGSINDVLPAATVGEIILTGPTISQGYLNDDALTRKKFVGGWWRSGDMGYIDDNGNLHVAGRIDNIINTGGIKVNGEEVEVCLVDHPAVAQVAVIGVADEKWGNRIEAHVSLLGTVTENELRNWCVDNGLASFKQPKTYVFHQQLPTGITGKLDRVSLRQEHGA